MQDREVTLHMTGYAPAYTKNVEKGTFVCVCVCVFMYVLLFKTIKNYKTMIKITTITGKSIKKNNKAASYNIKLTCTRQTSIQK